MPVYAPTVGFTEQKRHPNALLLIIGVHAVLIGAVMTAKMDLPDKIKGTITEVTFIDPVKPPPPPPQPPTPTPPKGPTISKVDVPRPILPTPINDRPIVDDFPVPIPNPGPIVGINPSPTPNPVPTIIRTGPRFATPDWALRPPYPADKQRLEQEAVLKLRLTIDERGRVVAVDPVGSVDRSFLEAARKHLLAKWRYKPATEDGRPVPSSTVITLRFELESA